MSLDVKLSCEYFSCCGEDINGSSLENDIPTSASADKIAKSDMEVYSQPNKTHDRMT